MLLRDLQLPDDAQPGLGRAAQVPRRRRRGSGLGCLVQVGLWFGPHEAVPRRADGDGCALQPVAVPDNALLVQGDEGPAWVRYGRLHKDPSLGEA